MMNKTPKFLRPFFTFYGGKWALAPLYSKPRYDTVIEPFAGSAGYSILYHEREVILIEADPAIYSVWDYLISATEDDIWSLPNLEQGEMVSDLVHLSPGARNLIGFWCGRGRATPGRRLSGWGREKRYARYYWGDEAKERISQQLKYIRHWTVLPGSYDSFPWLDDIPATWFIDPPYSSPFGRAYKHSTLDYSQLADWVLTRPGQVIVCEGGEAGWLPFNYLDHGRGNNGRKSRELVFEFES